MQWDLHASGEVSEEGAHSLSLNIALTSGIKMIESGLEVGVDILLGSLAVEAKMGLEDLVAWWEGVLWLEHEYAGFLTSIGGELSSVVGVHRPHELITASTLDIELGWDLSGIGTEMLSTAEVVPAGGETWMRTVLVPLGGDAAVVSLEFHGRGSSDESQNSDGFHILF